tara:strand:- start:149 stop:316 length:168 start_codon:yes stop_codon:yes gene_type:complete
MTTQDEEPIGDYVSRIWRECREEAGFATFFLNWCIQNHMEIVHEFMEFDQMMSGE